MKILVLCLFYGLVFGGILALLQMARRCKAVAPAAPIGGVPMRYIDLGLLALFFCLIPWLAYRFGKDSGNGIETDAYQRGKSRGA